MFRTSPFLRWEKLRCTQQAKAHNYEKHALRVSRVIAVLAKSACKHAISLATRVNYKNEQQNWIYAILLLVQKLLYFSFWEKSNKNFLHFSFYLSLYSSHFPPYMQFSTYAIIRLCKKAYIVTPINPPMPPTK